MNKILRLMAIAVMAAVGITAAMATDYYAQRITEIIPKPVSCYIDTTAPPFVLSRATEVYHSGRGAETSARYLADYTSRYLGLPMAIGRKSPMKPCVSLINRNNHGNPGGYSLTIDPDLGVVVDGNDEQGVFYGVQTLIQLLPTRAGVVPMLPAVRIADYPRFAYRGMHLDVVRHFFPLEFVKRYIDWLALHKMNYFHWHLTDDQGWRIELKSHPELTARASQRAGEIEGVFPGRYRPLPYGGYYTQEQIKEVVDYAANRYVTVVPEIDVPGHCMAVLAVHPEFSTTPQLPKVAAQTWGIYNRQNNVLAPTPEVFKFLSDVFNEVCSLFPGQYIHAGGDECAPRWWKESELTQQFIKKHGLIDENGLQRYFMDYVKRIVNSHGKTMIGWNGGIEQCDSAGAVVMNWHHRSSVSAKKLTPGHSTIIAPGRWFYFDYIEDSAQQMVMAGRRQLLTVKMVYDFNIVPDSATASQARLIMGAEGCMWAEYAPAPWKVELLVFPRLAALCENAWSQHRDWDDFKRRLVRQSERYDLWGIRYNPAVFLAEPTDPRYR